MPSEYPQQDKNARRRRKQKQRNAHSVPNPTSRGSRNSNKAAIRVPAQRAGASPSSDYSSAFYKGLQDEAQSPGGENPRYSEKRAWLSNVNGAGEERTATVQRGPQNSR